MTRSSLFTALVGASVLATAAISGCNASDDRDSYADREAQPSKEPASTADMAKPAPTDRSVASERMAGTPRDSMGGMQGETTDLAQADVVGQPVVSQDGEEIGKIASLVKDANGENEFAVVEVGEFLGIGEKQVAIDVRHLSLTADGKVQSNVTADALKSMPEYQSSDYEEEPEEETE